MVQDNFRVSIFEEVGNERQKIQLFFPSLFSFNKWKSDETRKFGSEFSNLLDLEKAAIKHFSVNSCKAYELK